MNLFTRRDIAKHGAALAAVPVTLTPAAVLGQARPDTLPAHPASAQYTPRNLLRSAYPAEKVASILLPRGEWRPYPTGADRAAWEGLPADARKRFIEAGEQALKSEWPELSATLMLEYTRMGNRARFDNANSARRAKLRALVMAETAEGKGRFLDAVLNAIWSFCEQTFWGSPAHVHYQKAGAGLPDFAEPTVDLFAGEAASELSWAVYYLRHELDKISPLICERVHAEVDRRMLTPCIDSDQHWMIRGMNWNPWCNSNWLISNLLLERNEKRRQAAVAKSMRSLDNFMNLYPDDGGCDEGPGYWGRAGGALFQCLELLHSATNGAVDIYHAPIVKDIGRYIYRAHVHDGWFMNFADASARSMPRGSAVYRYGRRIGDEKMMAFGAWALRQGGRGRQQDLETLFHPEGNVDAAPAYQPLLRDVWLKNIQVFAARVKEGSPEGFYIGALAGHNAESHNHNDVGNFILFQNGEPVIIDVGPEAYSAKTFSKQRYEIWTMSSPYHNLPTIGGVAQGGGREFEARDVSYKADDRTAELSMDIAKAYPANAGLESWRRTLRLDRPDNQVEVLERHSLSKPVSEITLSLMTPCVVTSGPGSELVFETAAGGVRLRFEGPAISVKIEEIPLEDERLRGTWGPRLRRVLLRAGSPPPQADWKLVFTAVKK